MTIKGKRRTATLKLHLLSLTALGALMPIVAHAQSTPVVDPAVDTAPAGEGDIVVTARSRNERLSDVPITINVVGSDTIRTQGIKGIGDLAKLAPTFAFLATLRGAATISMRGLSPNNANAQKQAVAFFVDGQFIAGENASFNLQDLDHVEILKGPQATHFGRSTYAGAVNYITRTPTDNHISGRVSGEYSSYNSYDLNGVINTPIVPDLLYATVSGRVFHRGGALTDRNYGIGLGEQRSYNMAGSLLLTPAPGLTLRVRGLQDFDNDAHQISYTLYRQDMSQYDQRFPTGQTYPVFALNSQFYRTDLLGASKGLGGLAAHTGDRNRRRRMLYWTADKKFDSGYELNYSGEVFYEKNYWYADVTNRWLADPTLQSVREVMNPIQNVSKLTSHQIRLTSPDNRKFKWMLGAYYVSDSYQQLAQFGKINFIPFSVTPGFPARSRADTKTENFALYGSASYPILDRLNLTLEGRYQEEKVYVDNCDLTACQAYATAFGKTSHDFLPRVTLDYKVTPTLLAYALYSKGVKSGVVNLSANATTAAAALTFQQANYQSPEKADNFEVGLKGSVLDHRLNFEAAAFHMNVTNQQVSTLELNSSGQLVALTGNGGASSIWGAEFSGTATLTRAWNVTYGVGYAHQEYTSAAATNSILIGLYGASSPNASLKGLQSQMTPRWTMNASTEYHVPIGANDLTFQANWNYVGKRYVDVPNLISLNPYNKVDASATFHLKDQGIDIGVFVTNLTNDKVVSDAGIGYSDLAEQAPSTRVGASPSILVNLPYPRTVGVRGSVKF